MKKEYSILSKKDYIDEGMYNLYDLYNIIGKGNNFYFEKDIDGEDHYIIEDAKLVCPLDKNLPILEAIDKWKGLNYNLNLFDYDNDFFKEYQDCCKYDIINSEFNRLMLITREFISCPTYKINKFIKLFQPEKWLVKDLM